METRRVVHPSADVLKAFGLGKLDDSSAGVLMDHLDQCADCCKMVVSQSGDDFLNRLRQVHGHNSTVPPANALSESVADLKPPQPKSPSPQTAIPNLPPELASNPQYEILRELGRGGMGVVYLAKNKLMDRLEVLKVVNKALLDRPGAVERFLREIRSAAKLSHANVVAAYSAVQVGDLLAFAMEYVEGQDLTAVVKAQGPLPVSHACYYVQQAALGLQHAFEKNMVHRDIKPQNLILAREGKKHIVKVLDFGLAKVMREKAEDSGLTGDGKMLGTPDYIAPEQTLDAASADIRADIYSLGCTLYYLLSGHPPFSAASLGAILLAHQMQEAKLLNVVRSEVPEELAAVVRKMMAKERAKRYQTPLEVAQALAVFVKPGVKGGTTPKSSPDLSLGTPKMAGVKAAKADGPAAPPAASAKPTPPEREATGDDAWSTSVMERGIASRPPRRSGAVRQRRPPTAPPAARKKWWIGGGLSASVLLIALVGMWAGGVFKVKTKEGTIVLENLPADAEVVVDGETVTARSSDGKTVTISVAAGKKHQLQVKYEGFKVFGKVVEIDAGDRQTITVRLDPLPVAVADATPAKAPDVERPVAEWVLARGGTVEVRVNEEAKKIDAVGNLPAESFQLLAINLSSKQVGDAGLERFKGLTNLTSLILWNARISDAGLAHLKELTNLRELLLFANPGVTDAGLAHLKDLTNLRNLDLNATQVTDAGMVHLKSLTNLIGLNFMSTRISGSGFVHLEGLPNLTVLLLANSKVDDRGLAQLKGLSKLNVLSLDNTRISDAGLFHLKGFKRLRDLYVLKTKVTNAGVADLQKALPQCRIHSDPLVATDAKGFVPLFNGKDLTGWKTHPKQPGNWRVLKGAGGDVLTGSGPAASYLYTERGDYKDFHLRVEARINDGGNSGVYCRSTFGPQIPANNPWLPLGYEAQINSTHGDVNKNGSLYVGGEGAVVSIRQAPVPPEKWFTMEAIVEGKRIIVKVNGKTTADYTDDKRLFTSGHIALQQHDPKTVVEFRKIEIKELPPAKSEIPAAANAVAAKSSPPGGESALPPEAKAAAKAFEKACADAREKLLAEFDTALDRLAKSTGSTEQRLKLIDAVKAEKERFESKGLIPWSEPMRPFLAKYFASTSAAESQVHRAYNSLIDAQLRAKKESAVADLQADLSNLLTVRVMARWRYFLDGKLQGIHSFYSNGRIDNINGKATWIYAKGVLIDRWPDAKAPGGVWIDSLKVSADGTALAGTNNGRPGRRPKITGVYVKDN